MKLQSPTLMSFLTDVDKPKPIFSLLFQNWGHKNEKVEFIFASRQQIKAQEL